MNIATLSCAVDCGGLRCESNFSRRCPVLGWLQKCWTSEGDGS